MCLIFYLKKFLRSKLYYFLFTLTVPHQPRLDWQMWFAALGNYEHNPWFVSFIYRLLDGEKDGKLDLMLSIFSFCGYSK